jgi:hypothetical protein
MPGAAGAASDIDTIGTGVVWTPLNPSDRGAEEEKASKFGSNSPLKRPARLVL